MIENDLLHSLKHPLASQLHHQASPVAGLWCRGLFCLALLAQKKLSAQHHMWCFLFWTAGNHMDGRVPHEAQNHPGRSAENPLLQWPWFSHSSYRTQGHWKQAHPLEGRQTLPWIQCIPSYHSSIQHTNIWWRCNLPAIEELLRGHTRCATL